LVPIAPVDGSKIPALAVPFTQAFHCNMLASHLQVHKRKKTFHFQGHSYVEEKMLYEYTGHEFIDFGICLWLFLLLTYTQ
jgi:hypothetical protein